MDLSKATPVHPVIENTNTNTNTIQDDINEAIRLANELMLESGHTPNSIEIENSNTFKPRQGW